jgi:hypothetical protein
LCVQEKTSEKKQTKLGTFVMRASVPRLAGI